MPSGPVIMRCVRVEGIRTGLDPSGMWLKSWDPDGGPIPGRGLAEWTRDPAKALVFAGARDAMAAWRAIPRARPRRPDGQPNRPLSAYSITLDPAPRTGAGAADPP